MRKNFRGNGFTLVEVMFVVGIIAVLAAIIIPSMVRSRATAQAQACINNLKQIDAADNQFSIDHALPAGSTVNYPSDLMSYFRQNTAPSCPARGTYAIAAVAAFPTCSLGTNVTPSHILQ